MLWMKANEPGLYARAARFVQPKDYVVGHMTGRFDSTDMSDATHAQWMDIGRRAYAADMLAELGLDVSRLPELHRATDVVGTLCPEAARAMGLPDGIPVTAGGGDGSCATVGAGAVREGDTYCCLGTTAWIASMRPDAFIDPQMRLFCIQSLDGEGCGVFGTVQSAGRSLEWIMQTLDENFAALEDLLGAAPPGSDGLVFLPYLEGERSPIWDTDARGVFFGLAPVHGRGHFVRATVEGVSYALRSVLDIIRGQGDVAALRLIGGGGRSGAWQRMLADICRVDVQLLSTHAEDATSLGAAIAAGVGVGLWPTLAEGVRSISVTTTQRHDPAAGEVYDRRFALYQSLYPRLKEAFAELRASL